MVKKPLQTPAQFKDKNYHRHIINSLDYLDPSLYTLESLGEEKVNQKKL